MVGGPRGRQWGDRAHRILGAGSGVVESPTRAWSPAPWPARRASAGPSSTAPADGSGSTRNQCSRIASDSRVRGEGQAGRLDSDRCRLPARPARRSTASQVESSDRRPGTAGSCGARRKYVCRYLRWTGRNSSLRLRTPRKTLSFALWRMHPEDGEGPQARSRLGCARSPRPPPRRARASASSWCGDGLEGEAGTAPAARFWRAGDAPRPGHEPSRKATSCQAQTSNAQVKAQ